MEMRQTWDPYSRWELNYIEPPGFSWPTTGITCCGNKAGAVPIPMLYNMLLNCTALKNIVEMKMRNSPINDDKEKASKNTGNEQFDTTPNIAVIMAGDDHPSYMAKPVSFVGN
ncbi:hypothetical protein SDJN02_14292, partial [Cucurbita argyrosperma subsp. argyrosperma]